MMYMACIVSKQTANKHDWVKKTKLEAVITGKGAQANFFFSPHFFSG